MLCLSDSPLGYGWIYFMIAMRLINMEFMDALNGRTLVDR